MSIGDNIKEKRKALNLSQKDVARAVGISQATMTNIENDYRIRERAGTHETVMQVLKARIKKIKE